MSDHPNGNGEHANAELMRLMGSKNGHDPIPPSQYLCFLTDRDPRQKMLAYVRSTTIRQGHRSPYCVDKNGRAISLSQIAAYFKWDLGFTSRIWSQLEAMKLVAKDKENRLCLCGNVPDIIPPPREEDGVDCTVNLPPYIIQQINKLTPVIQAECKRKLTAFFKFSDTLEADAIAAARAVAEPIEAKLFAEFNLRKKPGKKRRETPLEVIGDDDGTATAAKSEFVQLTLLTVPNFDVQSNGDVVQSEEPPTYNGENGVVQGNFARPTLYTEIQRSEITSAAASQVYINDEGSSSSSSTPEEKRRSTTASSINSQTGTATARAREPEAPVTEIQEVGEAMAKYGPTDDTAVRKLVKLCLQQSPDATVAEVIAVIHEKGPQANSRETAAGFLLTAVPRQFEPNALARWRHDRANPQNRVMVAGGTPDKNQKRREEVNNGLKILDEIRKRGG